MHIKNVVIAMIGLLFLIRFGTLFAQSDEIITEDNLMLGYIVPGYCRDISPDAAMLMIQNEVEINVIDIESGTIRLTIPLMPNHTQFQQFSPDSRYLSITYDGIYDIHTGERIAAYGEDARLQFSQKIFSPDGRYAVVKTGESDGLEGYLYDLTAGKRVKEFDIEYGSEIYWRYSPDGRFLAIEEVGVYDLNTLELILEVEGNFRFNFSPDGQYLYSDRYVPEESRFRVRGIVFDLSEDPIRSIDVPLGRYSSWSQDGRYITGLYRTYQIPEGNIVLRYDGVARISNNSQYIAISRDGIYDLADGSLIVAIPDEEFLSFSSTNTHAITRAKGTAYVYELSSGERLHSLPELNPRFSADGSLIVSYFYRNCVAYDVITGEERYTETGYGDFSSNRRYMVIPDSVNIGTYERSFCRVYSTDRSDWQHNVGFVQATGVNVRETPSAQSWIVFSGSGEWTVAATTPERDWYLVRINKQTYGWVFADVVETRDLPDSVPILTE